MIASSTAACGILNPTVGNGHWPLACVRPRGGFILISNVAQHSGQWQESSTFVKFLAVGQIFEKQVTQANVQNTRTAIEAAFASVKIAWDQDAQLPITPEIHIPTVIRKRVRAVVGERVATRVDQFGHALRAWQ